MQDQVIVKSKTINNEAVEVVIGVIEPGTGEKEYRNITRSIIFKDFQAIVPIRWAKAMIKKNPNEFFIAGAKGEVSAKAEKTIEVAQEKIQGFKCEFCGAEPKSKAGLSAHIRFNHPEKWEGKKRIVAVETPKVETVATETKE